VIKKNITLTSSQTEVSGSRDSAGGGSASWKGRRFALFADGSAGGDASGRAEALAAAATDAMTMQKKRRQ
jgi:hypothetical protein